MVRGTAHLMEGERVRELGWFSPKKRRLRGILLLSPTTYWEVTEMVEPDSFHRCTMIGGEATDTSWNVRNSD